MYVCHTYHALGKSWHHFSDTRVSLGAVVLVTVPYRGMGIMALDDGSVRRVLYESVAPIQQRYPWEKNSPTKPTSDEVWLPNHFFLGWQGLGCSFPGYF